MTDMETVGFKIKHDLAGIATEMLLTILLSALVMLASGCGAANPLFAAEEPPQRVLELERPDDSPTDEAQPRENASTEDLPEPVNSEAELPTDPTAEEPQTEATATPQGVWVELLEGNALEFTQPPELHAFANDEENDPPPEIQLAPFCRPDCFRYQQWLGMTRPGESYEVIFGPSTDTIGVQFWGDAGDGIAHVYVDGQEVWQGNTEGTDGNYPGGAFVKYLQISNLPDIPNHILRIETDESGGSVTMYFFGSGRTGP